MRTLRRTLVVPVPLPANHRCAAFAGLRFFFSLLILSLIFLCARAPGAMDAAGRSRRTLSLLLVAIAAVLIFMPCAASGQLKFNYYNSSCPTVESIVRSAVTQKLRNSSNAAPGTLRLFFHDCFVRGCDASVLLSSANGDDEQNTGADATLSPDALDLMVKAKAAVEAQCASQVSCADILALAARDVVFLSGGPWFPVELGRLDGKQTSRAIVKHSLPAPDFNLDQLTTLFTANGLSQTDMIALSGAHTLGVAHCDKFIRRIFPFKGATGFNPPMDVFFERKLRQTCPLTFSTSSFATLDAVTPFKFDNAYYQNLQQMKGLLASDQILFTDRRSRGTVNWFASNQTAFFEAFMGAMTRLGRVGVKTGSDGEIRRVCSKVNS